MNKQEVIDDIENAIPDFILNDYQRGKEAGLTYALELVKEFDEPEKPIVPQFVADWYEDNEDGFEFNLYTLCLDYNNCEVDKKLSDWFCDKHNKPLETLVNMHQLGYEVEKEKLYTVRLKATGEFIYFKKLFQCYNSGTSVKPVAHDNKEYHHAENVLKELLFWDNPAFEIKEVKKYDAGKVVIMAEGY